MEPGSIDNRMLTPEQLAFSNAASGDDPATVRAMLEKGMNPNYCDKHGQTPLHLAVDGEIDWDDPNPTPPEIGLVRLLLEHGANPNAIDKMGRTPLDWAASDGMDGEYIHIPGARALREFGGKHSWELRPGS